MSGERLEPAHPARSASADSSSSQHVICLRALDAQRRRLAGFWSWAGNDHACNQKRVDCRTISFIIADCWRCISAVQKPRAAPAQLFAALNHMPIQGFFITTPSEVPV